MVLGQDFQITSVKEEIRRFGTQYRDILYTSVSQTMVRRPQVVLEVCPCVSLKKIEEKIKFK
jgi:hypothetical protein